MVNPSNPSTTAGSPSLRKRDVRALCRALSLSGAILLGLNLVTLHYVSINICYCAAATLLISAVVNSVTAFISEGSCRSLFGAVTDLTSAIATVFAYLLQAGALELESKALGAGLTLMSMVFEVYVIVVTLTTSVIGQAVEVDNLKKKKEQIAADVQRPKIQ